MRNYLLLVVILCTILSCNHNQNDNKENKTLADSTYNKQAQKNSTTNETELPKNAFLKTVDIKFKVKDVVSTTTIIENICNAQGGFLTYSNLLSSINNKVSVAVSIDSSMEINNYSVSNSIIIRVPNNKLDTVLKAIALDVDYLDHRIIKADDVGLQIFTNKLTTLISLPNLGITFFLHIIIFLIWKWGCGFPPGILDLTHDDLQ